MNDYTSAVNEGSMTQLLHLSDQLGAAVADVQSAWGDFKMGPSSETTSSTSGPDAGSMDRLYLLSANMEAQIASLRDLAQSMRERA